jgi:hypothetical protein
LLTDFLRVCASFDDRSLAGIGYGINENERSQVDTGMSHSLDTDRLHGTKYDTSAGDGFSRRKLPGKDGNEFASLFLERPVRQAEGMYLNGSWADTKGLQHGQDRQKDCCGWILGVGDRSKRTWLLALRPRQTCAWLFVQLQGSHSRHRVHTGRHPKKSPELTNILYW